MKVTFLFTIIIQTHLLSFVGFNFKLPEKAAEYNINLTNFDERQLTGVKKLEPTSIQRAEVIGSGAFSKVYKGFYNGKLVAVKDLNFSNERETEMWFREVQILGYLFSYYFLYRSLVPLVCSNYFEISLNSILT